MLYPKPTKYQSAHLEVIKGQLAQDEPEGVRWREKQQALMGDVSQFMKLLKQRFSVWFNRAHQRYGTLWAERFKSVLVEAKAGTIRTMAAYIDLNAVRAGLVDDPKDYRFCGYGEAVAGHEPAREGFTWVVEGPSSSWQDLQSSYRQTLFGKGGAPGERGHRIGSEEVERVMRARGKLPLHEVLRCRVRYFSDGAVLGSRAFVQEQLQVYQQAAGRRNRTRPRPLANVTHWGGELTTLRGLRRQVFG